jgi:hypothetical protein
MEDDERWKDGIEDTLKTHGKKIESLSNWRTWLIGIGTGIAIMTGTFASEISQAFKRLGGQ